MDRSWMSKDRLSKEYIKGVDNFLGVAQNASLDENFI